MNRQWHLTKADELLHGVDNTARIAADLARKGKVTLDDLNEMRQTLNLTLRRAEAHMHMAELMPIDEDEVVELMSGQRPNPIRAAVEKHQTWKEHRMDRVLNADVGPPPSEDELDSDRNE